MERSEAAKKASTKDANFSVAPGRSGMSANLLYFGLWRSILEALADDALQQVVGFKSRRRYEAIYGDDNDGCGIWELVDDNNMCCIKLGYFTVGCRLLHGVGVGGIFACGISRCYTTNLRYKSNLT